MYLNIGYSITHFLPIPYESGFKLSFLPVDITPLVILNGGPLIDKEIKRKMNKKSIGPSVITISVCLIVCSSICLFVCLCPLCRSQFLSQEVDFWHEGSLHLFLEMIFLIFFKFEI